LKDFDKSQLEKLPTIESLYNPNEVEDILEMDNIENACQIMLELICKFLYEVKLDSFVQKNLAKILKSDELLSQADKGELFKKDNVKSKVLQSDSDADSKVSSDVSLDAESDASNVEEAEEIEDSNNNVDFGTEGFDYEIEDEDEEV
jgi:hypothetical protein